MANSNHSKQSKESKWDQANCLSRYFLGFMGPTFRKGYLGKLRQVDLDQVPREDQSEHLGQKLSHQLDLARRSFLKSLLATFGGQLVFLMALDLTVNCLAAPLESIALGWVIADLSVYQNAYHLTNEKRYLTLVNETFAQQVDETRKSSHTNLIVDTVILIASLWSNCLINHSLYLSKRHVGMKMRISVANIVYRKCLSLKQEALCETSIGQLVDLLASDVARFDSLPSSLCCLVSGPAQTILVLTLLVVIYVGWLPMLIGLACIIATLLVQVICCICIERHRHTTSSQTDKRMHLVYEIVASIKCIKMYTWEHQFASLISAARQAELRAIELTSVFRVINKTLALVSGKAFVVSTCVSFVMLGSPLETSVVFAIIGLMNCVSLLLCGDFPTALANFRNTLESSRRVEHFLKHRDFDNQSEQANLIRTTMPADPDSQSGVQFTVGVRMKNVSASWDLDQNLIGDETKQGETSDQKQASDKQRTNVVINNLSMEAGPGELVLIVGRVGTGKSSVLMTVMGELQIDKGSVQVQGQLSYASQDAWIFAASLRDNILFGQGHEPKRYQQVLKCCLLDHDISALPLGDKTNLGEHGVSLSGGQRARVNLARALYRKADIYLLDDPLSAVDEPSALKIFEEAMRSLLQDKSVILASNQLQFLSHANKILVLDADKTKVAQFGSLAQVSQTGAFKALDFHIKAIEHHKDKHNIRTRRHLLAHHKALRALTPETNKLALMQANEQKIGLPTAHATGAASKDNSKQHQPLKGMSELATYIYYGRNGATCFMFLWFLFICLGSQLVLEYIEFFLSLWTSESESNDINERAETDDDGEIDKFAPKKAMGAIESYFEDISVGRMSRYSIFLVSLALLTVFLRLLTFNIISLEASISIHAKLLRRILWAPLSFFDSHSSNSILSILGQEMLRIDETLPQSMLEVQTVLLTIIGSILLAMVVDVRFVVPGIVLVLMGTLLHHLTMGTVIRLKAIEGRVRAPILSHLSISLSGLATIRALNGQEQFIKRFECLHNDYSGVSFVYICSITVVSSLQYTTIFIFTTLVTSLMIGYSLDTTNATLIGLLIMKTLDLPQPIEEATRKAVELESSLGSLHRVEFYTRLEPEQDPAASSTNERPRQFLFPNNPPEVRFESVTFNYVPKGPIILRKVSFAVAPGERVAILGSTGAGKSSLIAALFRLYPYEGHIYLNASDTSELSLEQLRNSITIIPQEPVLLSGSLRLNLDPFESHSDETLWRLLEQVQLKSLFEGSQKGLDFEIQESGSNLSIGQRQLVCLARAIVHKKKLVVLDEATASIDPETDATIQRNVTKELKECTVLCIAHRLTTIATCRRVLVLDKGQIAEFDEPLRLLESKTSHLSRMLEAIEPEEARALKQKLLDRQARSI